MNTHPLIAASIAAILLSGCASTPPSPVGAAEARSKLTRLQANPDLATRAPAAIKDAELAVRTAELPQNNLDLANHLVYVADRKVDIAAAQAATAMAESQRQGLSDQRDKARLDARTREADKTASRLATANGALADEKRNSEASRDEADAARLAAVNAAVKSAQLQQQLDKLNARPTDRGMVLTLGDVLFTSGQADLKAGAATNLNKLALFLTNYPDRNVTIEGYTDSVGSEDYNVGLSQRRADSVKTFLAGQGVGSARLTAAGKGKSNPVAANDSAAGRQQNRRVEVIISNPQTVSR